MNTATVGANAATFLVYGASLIVVLWCVIDVTRRPSDELTVGRKAVLGACVAGRLAAVWNRGGSHRRVLSHRSSAKDEMLQRWWAAGGLADRPLGRTFTNSGVVRGSSGAHQQSANPVTPDRGQAAKAE